MKGYKNKHKKWLALGVVILMLVQIIMPQVTWSAPKERKAKGVITMVKEALEELEQEDQMVQKQLYGSVQGRTLVNYTNKKFEDTSCYTNRFLGVANDFHLFASDTITLSAHCNGNYAAPKVIAANASGTNQVYKEGSDELSFVHEMERETSNILSNQIVVKEQTPLTKIISTMDGEEMAYGTQLPNQVKFFGSTLDMQKNQNICIAGEDFIDFSSEFTKLRNFSQKFSRSEATMTQGKDENQEGTYDLTDQNHSYIHVTPNKVNILNCNAEDLADGAIYISGFTCNQEKGTSHAYDGKTCLVVNVDCKGNEEITLGKQTESIRCLCGEAEKVTNGEGNYYLGSVVLWNFYDSSQPDNLYTGSVVEKSVVNGSYLAPNASIVTKTNANGTLIAKNIEIKAQSHRADFLGSPFEEKPEPSEPSEPTEAEVSEPSEPSKPTEAEVSESSEPSKPTEAEVSEPSEPSKPTEAEVSEPTEPSEPTEAEVSEPTEPSEPTEVEVSEPIESSEPTEVEISKPAEPEPSVPTRASEPTRVSVPTKASEPTRVSVPTKASEPTRVSVPTKASEPTKVSVPTRVSEPTRVSVPTRVSEPTRVSVPTKVSEPTRVSISTKASEPTRVSVPTKVSEPTRVSVPTRASEPTRVSVPTKVSEPTRVSVPTRASEPTRVSVPTKASEPASIPSKPSTVTEKKGSIQIKGTNEVRGETEDTVVPNENFTYVVKEGDKIIATADRDGSGNLIFTEITYTKDDIGTHEYVIEEKEGTIDGMTYDTATRVILVTVKDNGGETLDVTVDEEPSFINIYGNPSDDGDDNTGGEDGNGTSQAPSQAPSQKPSQSPSRNDDGSQKKKATGIFSKQSSGGGAELAGATLELTYEDGEFDLSGVTQIAGPSVEKKKNKRVIRWVSTGDPVILKNLPKGEYAWTETGAPQGYKYAETIYFIVKEDGNIYLEKTDGSGYESKPVSDGTIVMKDEAKGGTLTLHGVKKVEGTGAPQEAYSFSVREGENLKTTGHVYGAGNIEFAAITYGPQDIGTHTYRVEEIKGSTVGMEYDASVKTLTVEVRDPGDSAQELTVTMQSSEGDMLTFTNKYSAATISQNMQTVTGQANGTSGASNPKTGDEANLMEWILLLAAAGTGVVVMIRHQKKKKVE